MLREDQIVPGPAGVVGIDQGRGPRCGYPDRGGRSLGRIEGGSDMLRCVLVASRCRISPAGLGHQCAVERARARTDLLRARPARIGGVEDRESLPGFESPLAQGRADKSSTHSSRRRQIDERPAAPTRSPEAMRNYAFVTDTQHRVHQGRTAE